MNMKHTIFGLIIIISMFLPTFTIVDQYAQVYKSPLNTDANSGSNKDLVSDLGQIDDGSLPKDELYQKLLNSNALSEDSYDPGAQGNPSFNEYTDLANVLPDQASDFQQTWEPWATKAGIRVMITSPDQEFLVLGTGYLLDNTVKVYRYNNQLNQYVHVTDLGSGIIHGDVISLAWGDTDHNNFPEIIAGSADGFVYVFEQTHIYDPKTNLENNFQLVWTSPRLEQVWGVALGDTDLDFQPDIITGSWDSTVRWYEYVDHSGYPFSLAHWIDYKERYVAKLPNKDKVTSIATTDINGNGLPDVIVGTWSGAVYVYENNGTVLDVAGGKKFPIAQDNSYKLIYSNTNQFWNPITRIVKGNLDDDIQSELAFLIPGQGVFTFDYDANSGKFFFNKLIKDVLPTPNYELGANGKKLNDWTSDFAVNTYIDFTIYSHNVWSLGNNSITYYPEPLDVYNSTIYNFDVFPYDTAMAQRPDDHYAVFGTKPGSGSSNLLPLGDNATAIVDFGFNQEVTGDGRLTDGVSLKGYDLQIIMNATPNINQWDLSISTDNETWLPIKKSDMANGGIQNGKYYLLADTDPALNLNRSLYYRYLKMVYYGPQRAFVDSVNSTTLARAITEATAVAIGHIDTSYFNFFLGSSSSEKDRLITGTSDGKMFVHEYDESSGQVKMVYDFYGGAAGDRFTLGTNVWDIVEVKNSGTLPTWFGIDDPYSTINQTLKFSPSYQFYSDTYAHLNALELIAPSLFSRANQDLIVTDMNGKTHLYYGGSSSQFNPYNFFTNVNNYYGIGNEKYVSHAFGDINGDNFTELMVSTGWNGVVADPLQNKESYASIHLWMSTKTSYGFTPFTGNLDIAALETTGSLSTALKYTQAKPGATLVDLDGDGDLDIVFTNGRVYVIWNIANYLVWRFDSSYFESINSNLAGNLYYAPTSLDIDLDGDMDLIFSYALTGDNPRYGAVWYRNDGVTAGKSVFSYQKRLFINPIPETNLAFNNYTAFTFSIDYRTGKILNMTAFSDKLNALVGFKADYTNHNNFMIATYPLVHRVEINLRESSIFKNFGYRIFETWNTEPEIKKFTQSIQFTDLDHDGKGEVVVGDYDNNLYIFEYLTSGLNGSVQTYKIAYKSPDLVQHQTISQSPYAADQLAGLQGNFTRTIWRNAKFVLGGLDLNNNGLQEVVVTAGLAFYVFELDRFGNDQYNLIYMNDLSNSIFTPLIGQFVEFTALGGGIDSDFNGRGEIMLAIGPALFMFEYAGEGQFNEVYAGYPALGGRYFSIGNPVFANYFDDYVYKNMVITSIAVGDVNRNNYIDIVVGGYYQQPYGRLDGSLTILENRVGTIVPVYEFSPKDMRETPINDIKLADQDFDQNIEILVANDKAVDVWEYQAVSGEEYNFVRIGFITASMNHPIPKLNYLFPVPTQPDKTVYGRTQDILVIRTKLYNLPGIPSTDPIKNLNPGDLIEVATIAGLLIMAYSRNDGKTWNFILNGGNPFIVPGVPPGYGITLVEYDPSIIQLSNGNIAIAYMTNLSYNTGSGIITLTVVAHVQMLASGAFTTPFAVATGTSLGSPSIFVDPHAGSGNGAYSIAYLDFNTQHISVGIGYNATSLTTTIAVNKTYYGKGDFSENATYLAQRIDVAYYPLTDQYILAFSGRIYNESKADVDIFTSVANNHTLTPLYTSRVSSSSTQDRFPSISVLQDEHSWGLVVAYQEDGIDPGNRIMASHSKDIGRSWNPPEPMNRAPDNLVNICFIQLGLGCFMFLVSDPSMVNQQSTALHPELDYTDTFMYDIILQQATDQKSYANKGASTNLNVANLQLYWVTSIVTERPAIAGRSTGGFAYSFATTLYLGDLVSLLYRILIAMASVNSGNQKSNYNVRSDNVALLATDRLTVNTLVIGKIETIAIGVNPNSEFAKFDVGKALQIDTGDTDGDGRQEIIIASDRGVFLSEISHNYNLTRIYDPIWQKMDYPFGIHDVTLGDANGNGFDEIYVAGEEGNVFAYEISNQNLRVTDFDFTSLSNNRQTEFTNQPAPDPYSYQTLIKTIDITGDKILDIVYPSVHHDVTKNEKIYAVNGKTNATLWTYTIPKLGHKITAIELYDYNGDGKEDIIIGTTSGAEPGMIIILNSQNGAELYRYYQVAPSVQKMAIGHFNSSSYLSFAIISTFILYHFDPVVNLSTGIDNNAGDPSQIYYDVKAVNIKGNGLDQILTVTNKGVAKVYDLTISSSPHTLYTLNGATYGQSGNNHQIKTYTTAIAKYDIDKDGKDEMFLAINATIYAFDNTGQQLWNKTDLKMSQNLDKLTIVHSNLLNQDILTVMSYPKLLTFEDYNIPTGLVYNNYSSQGVTFGPTSWTFYNMTGIGGYYSNTARSGDYIIFSFGNDNGWIDFNKTQQYVSFYLTSQYNDSVRIKGLDETNRTIYISDFYNMGKNQLVSIALDKPSLKRIVFEAKYGFTTYHLIIDDLKFGGTNIFTFNALTGDLIWNQEFLPTASISFNPSVDVNNSITDNIVPLSYTIDDSFLPQLAYHQGLASIDLTTGKPNFMYTYAIYTPTMSAVSLGEGIYSFIAYYPYSAHRYILYSVTRVNSTGSFFLNYKVQNNALWQVNTNKIFTNIVSGQLDSDSQQEMIVYNKRLIAAINDNGQFIWKFVTSVDISQILMANLDNTGVDEVLVLLTDSTILTLDPTFGIQLNSQTLPFFVPVKMMAVKYAGSIQLIIGEKNPTDTFGGLLRLKYLSVTHNFTLSGITSSFGGSFKDFYAMDYDNNGDTDFILEFDQRIVLLWANFTIFMNSYSSTIKLLGMTVGDYNSDNYQDWAFIYNDTLTQKSYLKVYSGNKTLNEFSEREVKTGLLVLPGQKILYSIDLTRDGKSDIVQYQFGRGFALYNPLVAGNPIGYWHERSWISGFLTDLDIDFDGYNDLIVRNERLIYAIRYDPTNSTNLDHFYTFWSSPLSNVPILQAVPVKLTNTNTQLVYLNMFGQLFAVEGIISPYTQVDYQFKFNYQSKTPGLVNIDLIHWTTSSWSEELFDNVVQLPTIPPTILFDQPTSQTQISDFKINIQMILLFVLTFFTGVVTTTQLIKRNKSKMKSNIKEQETSFLGGVEK